MQEAIAVGPKVSWIFIFVMLYWAYCIYWGVKGSLAARTAEEYFIAGRSLGFWGFIFAATATSFSGWTFLGHPGLTYTDGLQYAFASLYAITIPLTGVLFLKRQWLLGQHFGFITPGEMLAYYFRSDLIRVLVVLVALVFSIPYLGLQLRASGFLFNVLTDNLLGVEFGMWVLSFVVLSYVASGGLRTVAQVDILQALLLAAGIVIIGCITLYFIGGWERLSAGFAMLVQEDPVRTPDGYSHYVAIPGVIQFVEDGSAAEGGAWTGMMIMTYMFGLMGIQASPAFSMWAFASRDPRPFAPQQVWVSGFCIGLILIFFTAIQGIGSHFLGADQMFSLIHPELSNPLMTAGLEGRDLLETSGKQDMLVPQLINLLSFSAPWLVGLLAVCALAAMESSASCYMATAGGLLTRDVIKRFLLPEADDRTQKFVGRIATVIVVLLALLVATSAEDALVLLGGLAVSYGFQMCPALLAACYWPFLTRQGVACGLLVGLIVVTVTDSVGTAWFGITAWGRWPLTIHAAGWGIVCNLTVALLVSCVSRDDQQRKREFHDLLKRHKTSRPSRSRSWHWLAWVLTLGWFLLAIGPGAVLGNTWFADPTDPASWPLGMPSLWLWQLLAWISGVGILWFLAYFIGMSAAPARSDDGRDG